mgnify:CR=1 FL=1
MAIRGIKKYEKTEKEKELEKIQRAKDKAFGERLKEAGVGQPFMKRDRPEYSTTRPSGLRGGGRATRGLGKAFMKGGRAK